MFMVPLPPCCVSSNISFKFQNLNSIFLTDVASGGSVDWVYNTLGVKLGYTIEFRDKGRYGFVLPPVQILPNCEELMAGMIALVNKSKDLKYV